MSVFKPIYLKNVDLLPYNTFGVSVFAHHFATFRSVNELHELINAKKSDTKPFFLGGGSNVLLTEDVSAPVLKNEIKEFTVLKRNDNVAYVRVGAGENWHQFVMRCLSLNFGGLENLSLIPGNVGASPMQNIGAYGVEMKQVFHCLEAYNMQSQKIETFDKNDCEFDYRESVFKTREKGKYAILNVTFCLRVDKHELHTDYRALSEELQANAISEPTIHDVSRAVMAIRKRKLPDPAELGNAGSFFKNPILSRQQFDKIQEKFPQIPFFTVNETQIKIPAGWLIEQAGWKGKKIGKCGVHDKQALVLVNYGGASGKQIKELSEQIIADIFQKYEVLLQAEVNIIL